MIAETQDIERPPLTMPEREAALLEACYRDADNILEYGAGGSTVLAAELSGKHITSVESDRRWVRRMRRWFALTPPVQGSSVELVWANIGATSDWGHPADDTAWRRFADYPLGIWKRKGLPHPDVVLVDGRFRVGCALATAFNITRPVTLLFDDYTRHNGYRQVEGFIGVPEMTGRMARFRVEPAAIPADRLLQIVKFMSRP